MIVEVEGNDAVGKATQAALLAERLKGTCITAPDYNTETGKAIFANLKKEWAATPTTNHPWHAAGHFADDKLNALAFQSLMILNRYEMLPRIALMLAKGPVVFDRWTSSSTVYGACAGLDPKWCDRVQLALPQADVHILIDIPVEESFKRRPERRDRHETDRPFLEKVRTEYLRRWGWEGASLEAALSAPWNSLKADKRNWQVVNGTGTARAVHERICNVLYDNIDALEIINPWIPAAGWPEGVK